MVLVVKNPPANARDIKDVGSIPGSGRSQEENGNQSFCQRLLCAVGTMVSEVDLVRVPVLTEITGFTVLHYCKYLNNFMPWRNCREHKLTFYFTE